MAWWLITGPAMLATHAFRRHTLARVAEESTELAITRESPSANAP